MSMNCNGMLLRNSVECQKISASKKFANCWIHVLILCFLGFAICALCHCSCLHARVVSGHFSMSCLYFLFLFSLFDHCLLSFLCLSLDFLFLSLGPLSFFCLRESLFLICWCVWHFRTKCQFVYHRAIVYCLLRKSLGCLNWLVYMPLLGEVSIC